MTQLNVQLHPKQLEVFQSDKRFKTVAAGRRFGKTRLAAWMLLIWALHNNKSDAWVFYVAPTFQQAKDVVWTTLKELGRDVITAAHENTGVLTLVNGCRIGLKGSDRPDTLRGVALAGCVIDEYADMKPFVFEQILRPALGDVKGPCLFIGTPKGRNHFYDLWKYADSETDDEWESFHYTSYDKPFLDPKEIDNARKTMSSFAFRQEFLASFEAAASDIFKEEWIKYDSKEPKEGEYYIAVDLAGFADVSTEASNKRKRLDETAISVVKVGPKGWWVKEIQHGRWDVRECAVRILKAAKDNKALIVGIEAGSLKNAVMPYLFDLMKRLGTFPRIEELRHGNKKKTDRIVWSLQGRFEHGRIILNEGDWNYLFVDQLMQFPDPKTHDDLIDSLAYIDQIAQTLYERDFSDSNFEVIDAMVGY
jgi:phage terminase large subunit-like protein